MKLHNFKKLFNFPSLTRRASRRLVLREGNKRGELFTRSAFTLLELLIYIGLLAGFIAILGQLFFSILDTQLESQANSAVDAEGQYLVTRLNYDIRRADSVTVPADPGQTDSVLTLSIAGVSHTYALSGTDLTLTVSGNSRPLNSHSISVTDFSVRRLENPAPADPSILVDFAISSQTVSLHQEFQTRSYQISVNLQ